MRGKPRPAHERMRALSIAAVEGAETASERTGIPRRTISLWMEKPEYAELRQKTRDDLAEGFKVLANLAVSELINRVAAGGIEDRDLSLLAGIATDKSLLISGEATARTENKDITDDIPLSVKRQLRSRFADLAGDPGDGVAAEGAHGAAATEG